MCLLMATPHATEVELVYTTPAQRRRGLAYATVARAAAEADDACTFLFTDADGPAQRLYAPLGLPPRGAGAPRPALAPLQRGTASPAAAHVQLVVARRAASPPPSRRGARPAGRPRRPSRRA